MIFLCLTYWITWAQKTDRLAVEEEKDAKHQRSASTTPRSTMGTLPCKYDRVMGVASVGSQESVRFGEENDPETEDVQDTVAHNREDLDQTHEDRRHTHHDVNPGIGEFHGGFGSASFRECLGRVAPIFFYPLCCLPLWGRHGRKRNSHDQPATGYEPKCMEQNPSQDSTSAHDPPPDDTSHQSKET